MCFLLSMNKLQITMDKYNKFEELISSDINLSELLLDMNDKQLPYRKALPLNLEIVRDLLLTYRLQIIQHSFMSLVESMVRQLRVVCYQQT